ncbi:MAG TPA: BamA/TamA family outer membrane protein [Longimicrobiaceae bacterium]|nr:BamA/TamA family outer membrane protein [Longimicrobiaceae bacterium]
MQSGRIGGIALVLAALLAPGALHAQADSVTVVAGPEYAASDAWRLLFGEDYRHLWTTPVRVELLDLVRFAGGLTPVRTGGGNQTLSLRFQGADGREYAFRSVNKDHTRALSPDLQETVVDDVIQDQVSSLHPAAALVSDRLLEAAGVLHVSPRLVVMPDDARLGRFREQFAGMLGWLEVRPNEPERPGEKEKKKAGGSEDGEREQPREGSPANVRDDDEEAERGPEALWTAPAWAGADRIKKTENFIDDLEEGPEHRLDSRDYLAGRLMDLLFGDWDRHDDQYQWARFDRGRQHLWRAIPRDRDYVFVDYDGAAVRLAKSIYPKAVLYGPRFPGNLYGLTINAQHLDRRFLSDLTREDFDAVAAGLQARITDEVIESALRRMPPEYYRLSADELREALRGRRDRLRFVAGRFYAQLALEAEVHSTDRDELLDVARLPDGALEVRIFLLEGGVPAREPFFRRRFDPEETREVRIHLHGGDDRAVVHGRAGRSILVRVIGGGGDDTFEDRSEVLGTRTAFYDDRGENRFVPGRGTRVDRRRYERPEHTRGNLTDPPRDWGFSASLFTPGVGWRSNVGPVVSVGPKVTRYGFRRHPYATRWSLEGIYAPLEDRLALEYNADFRRVASPDHLTLFARLSEMEVTRFHGFGNETPGGGDGDRYKVWHSHLALEPLWHRFPADGTRLSFGPVLRWYDPELEPGTPAATLRPRGAESFGEVGAQAEAEWDRRDSAVFPRSGFRLLARGTAYPLGWDVEGPFGRTHAEANAYLSPGGERTPVLALRAGATRAWGDFPFQEAAFVGGSRTLRGYPFQRFAGDAAVYGNAELRVPLVYTKLLVRGDLGVTALADAGRVYLEGERSDRWHTALGGGVWFAFLQRSAVASLLFAHGERDELYAALRFPF